MVSAKSNLMKGTIPRNKLSGIMLITKVALLVKKALGDRVWYADALGIPDLGWWRL